MLVILLYLAMHRKRYITLRVGYRIFLSHMMLFNRLQLDAQLLQIWLSLKYSCGKIGHV